MDKKDFLKSAPLFLVFLLTYYLILFLSYGKIS